MTHLHLSGDQLLTTTRAVRRRLDLDRPVAPDLLVECTAIAQQAPSGRNKQRWDFVFVTDQAARSALAEVWLRGLCQPVGDDDTAPSRTDFHGRQWAAIRTSLAELAENIHRVPVLMVPCIRIGARAELRNPQIQASTWGSLWPAAWSFMLAARNRGLGTALTTSHLHYERDAAAVLGVPFDTVLQAALIPVAHTIGETFRPSPRGPAHEHIHWDRWRNEV